VNTNNDVKWRRFIVPKKVEQINVALTASIDHATVCLYSRANYKCAIYRPSLSG